MEFTVHLDASFLRSAYERRMASQVRALWIGTALFVAVAGLNAFIHGFSTWTVLELSALAAYVLYVRAGWRRQLKLVDGWLGERGEAAVTYDLGPATLGCASAQGDLTLEWTSFRKALISDLDTVLWFKGRSGELTLPTAQIPPEAMERLIERLAAEKIAISDRRTA